MKILENKWTSLACSLLNGFFAVQSYTTESWGICVLCSFFAVVCGYSFWKQLREE